MPWPNGERRQCLKSKPRVQLSAWPSFLSYQDYIESSVLNFFFNYDKIVYNIALFDPRYGQKVSGFILREDASNMTFLTP